MKFKIEFQSNRGHVFLSKKTFATKADASAEIARRKSGGGWDSGQFFVVDADTEYVNLDQPRPR